MDPFANVGKRSAVFRPRGSMDKNRLHLAAPLDRAFGVFEGRDDLDQLQRISPARIEFAAAGFEPVIADTGGEFAQSFDRMDDKDVSQVISTGDSGEIVKVKTGDRGCDGFAAAIEHRMM